MGGQFPVGGESTPSRGAVILTPTSQVKTTQATLVVVVVSAFTLGGLLMSIKNDIANQGRDLGSVRKDVDELRGAVFGYPTLSNSKTKPKED